MYGMAKVVPRWRGSSHYLTRTWLPSIRVTFTVPERPHHVDFNSCYNHNAACCWDAMGIAFVFTISTIRHQWVPSPLVVQIREEIPWWHVLQNVCREYDLVLRSWDPAYTTMKTLFLTGNKPAQERNQLKVTRTFCNFVTLLLMVCF